MNFSKASFNSKLIQNTCRRTIHTQNDARRWAREVQWLSTDSQLLWRKIRALVWRCERFGSL